MDDDSVNHVDDAREGVALEHLLNSVKALVLLHEESLLLLPLKNFKDHLSIMFGGALEQLRSREAALTARYQVFRKVDGATGALLKGLDDLVPVGEDVADLEISVVDNGWCRGWLPQSPWLLSSSHFYNPLS